MPGIKMCRYSCRNLGYWNLPGYGKFSSYGNDPGYVNDNGYES